MSIESVMPSNHLILCRPLLLPPSVFPSIRVFSNESALRIGQPEYWSVSFSTRIPGNEEAVSGLSQTHTRAPHRVPERAGLSSGQEVCTARPLCAGPGDTVMTTPQGLLGCRAPDKEQLRNPVSAGEHRTARGVLLIPPLSSHPEDVGSPSIICAMTCLTSFL